MSPNVWRKPEQRSSSAKMFQDSDSEDECQITGEKPGKSKSSSKFFDYLRVTCNGHAGKFYHSKITSRELKGKLFVKISFLNGC